MSLSEVVVRGTLNPDGTLQLDEKPGLTPGRVTVVLRQETELPKGEPFWQRMQAIWDAQKAAGHSCGSATETEAEMRRMRQEWEDRQQGIERLQEECHSVRQSSQEKKP
jgi:hypothetical protein